MRTLSTARIALSGSLTRVATVLGYGTLPAPLTLLALLGAAGACRGVESAPEEPPSSEGAPAAKAASSPWAPGATGAPGAGRPGDLQLGDLFGKQPLEGRLDTQHRFSKDGRWLFFLRPSAEDAEVLDLWRLALPSGLPERLATAQSLLALGKAELTEAQKSARERQRVRHRGITSFALDHAGAAVIVPLEGFVYRVDAKTGKASRIFATAGGELDPRPSPDGALLGFVRKGDLVLRDLGSGAERPLTRGGSETLQHGVAEFVAQEELERHRGYWWSPDGAYLALTRVDESGVERVHRHQISATGVKVVPQRYPAAGTPNAKVRLGVARVATGQVRWIPLPGLEEGYLARVDWFPPEAPPRPPRLLVQWLTRDQRTLTLEAVDPVSLVVTRLLVERAPDYVNLHDDLRLLTTRPTLLWTSEVTGLRQLYAMDWPAPGGTPVLVDSAEPSPVAPQTTEGKAERKKAPRLRALSELTEPLHRVEGVDEKGGWVYATVSANRGRELHLYRFSLAGDRLPERLTREPGWHEITLGRSAAHYVDRWSDLHQTPRAMLHRADGTRLRRLDEGPDEPISRFRTAQTRFVTLRAKDGTPLNGLLFTPPEGAPRLGSRRTEAGGADPGAKGPPRPRPAVIYVYGGPHGQTVARRWQRTTPWHHFFAQRGLAVLLVDGRGSALRGKTFEAKLWRRFGVVDAEDAAAAARWLGAQPGIDRERLGLWGWSYGGYLTVMTLLQTGRLFRAGAAVAPVTDWRLYDTAYTERYLGLPGPEEAVYRRSDPTPLASRLQARLLLVHGMADDNVLLTHTLRLTAALQKAERPFDLMLYPGKAHSIQGTTTRRHLLTTLLDFFRRELGDAAPREATTHGETSRSAAVGRRP